jgi:HPt (histidine-containing phosphotransfer) domain-containing protein
MMFSLIDPKVTYKPDFIDVTVLNDIREFMGEEGDGTVNELISIYLNNTPNAISQIGKDLESNDVTALKMHVHGLKGSSAQVGVIGISNLCRTMEAVISEGQMEDTYSIFEQIVGVFRRVEIEFKDML